MGLFKNVKSVNRGLFFLFLAVFIDLLGFGIVIPLLPFWSIDLGVSSFIFGVLIASYSAMQFVFAPIWGRISDKKGRRPVILIGLVGTLIGFGLLALTALILNTIIMLFISRIISGIFTAATLPTSQAYISDTTLGKDRTKGFGLLGAAFGMGFAIGPAVGGMLFLVGRSFGLVGYETPALFAVILAVINLVGAIRYLPESLTEKVRLKREGHNSISSPIEFKTGITNVLFKNPTLLILIIIFSILALSFSGMETTIALLGKTRFNMDQTLTGVLFLVVGLVAIITQAGIIRSLSNRYSDALIITSGIVIITISYLGITTVYSLVALTFWIIPLAFGVSISNPTLGALLSKKSPIKKQGQILGINQGMGSLMRVLGPLIGAFLFDVDVAYPYYLGAVLLMVAFVLMFYILKRAGEKTPTITACPNCGVRLQEGVAYCGQCGYELNNPDR